MKRRFWTDKERDTLRSLYGNTDVRVIARRLKRSVKAVHWMACKLQLTTGYAAHRPGFEAFVVEKNAAGWCDTDIGEAWGCDRHSVSRIRRLLGLPCHAKGTRYRERVKASTEKQLAAAGVASLAELKQSVIAERARQAGWPSDLGERHVQILNALWEHGPMTRRQIADAVGIRWKGVRKTFSSRDPGCSYLAYLARRGLVQVLKRAATVRGNGKGHSQHLYTLPFGVERLVNQGEYVA